MKKKNYFRILALKYSYLLIFFGIACVGYNSINVKGIDMIADTVDKMLAGEYIVITSLLPKLIVMIVVGTVLIFMKQCFNTLYSLYIEEDMRNMAVSHMETIEYSYFDTMGTGSILTRLTADIKEVQNFFSNSLPTGISYLITSSIIGIYIFQMNHILLVSVLIVYPIVFWITHLLSKRYKFLEKQKRKKLDLITDIIQDSLAGIIVIRSYNLMRPFKERLNRAEDAVVENEKARTKIVTKGAFLITISRWVPTISCCIIALHQCIKGRMTVGDMMSFTILLDQFIQPLSELPAVINECQEQLIPLERINSLLNMTSEVGGSYKRTIENQCKFAIELEDIHFAYPTAKEREILTGVDLKIEKGKVTAIVGNSGGGKTTLYKLFTGFYKPTSGTYRLNGVDFGTWDIQAARKEFALVSQNVFLFPLTISENIAYGKSGVTQEEIEAVCKMANIHDFITQLPEGYQTRVGERGIKLSGGERQRISIARAFLKAAPILLLDEPTSAVDTETERLIQEAIDRVSKGRTVIIIAHRLSTIERADNILVMNEGKVIEQGNHHSLLERAGMYASLYQRGPKEEEVIVDENKQGCF